MSLLFEALSKDEIVTDAQRSLATLADAPLDVRRALSSAGASLERWASSETIQFERLPSLADVFREAGEVEALQLQEAQLAWVRAAALLLCADDDRWLDADLTSCVTLADELVRYHDVINRFYVRRAKSLALESDVAEMRAAVGRVLGSVELIFGVERSLHTGSLEDMLRRTARAPTTFAARRVELLALGVVSLIRSLTRLSLRDYALFVTTIAETYDRAAPTLDRASLIVQLVSGGTGAFDESAFRRLFVGQPQLEWYAGAIPVVRIARATLLDAYVGAKDTVLALLALGVNALVGALPASAGRTLATLSSSVLALPLYNFLVVASFARLLSVLFARGALERDRMALERARRGAELERATMRNELDELRALIRLPARAAPSQVQRTANLAASIKSMALGDAERPTDATLARALENLQDLLENGSISNEPVRVTKYINDKALANDANFVRLRLLRSQFTPIDKNTIVDHDQLYKAEMYLLASQPCSDEFERFRRELLVARAKLDYSPVFEALVNSISDDKTLLLAANAAGQAGATTNLRIILESGIVSPDDIDTSRFADEDAIDDVEQARRRAKRQKTQVKLSRARQAFERAQSFA